jgi:hypothetical protein
MRFSARLPPRRTAALFLALSASLNWGCAAPDELDLPAVSRERLEAEHEEWRRARHDGLVAVTGGVVLWIGLFELNEGTTPFGADPDLPIVLPAEDSPPRAGTLRRTGRQVTLRPEPGAPLSIRDGDRVTDATHLVSDDFDDPTVLVLGSLGMRVHAEPGTDRLWLRVWDTDSPLRESFELPPTYPVDSRWRLATRLDRYRSPRSLRVPDVTGGEIEYEVPGELVFRVDGREHRLIAVDDGAKSGLLVMLWDSTATVDTYQGGRYLRVPHPDEDGSTVIDFNRAYNPPCVFTAHSVCALPPPENRLSVPLPAGERRPEAGGSS